MRRVSPAIIEEVGRGQRGSGKNQSQVGEVEGGGRICIASPVEMAPDLEAEVVRLRAELAEARGERPRVRQRVVEPMPQREQELWDWMSSKQQELRDVLEFGGSRNVVLELTSKLAEAAERLHTLQNRDDVVM